MSIMSEKARVTKLFRYVLDQMPNAGDTVTYPQILDICGIPQSRALEPVTSITATLVRETNSRLHRSGDWRWLVNVPTVGYRVGTPAEVREDVFSRQKHITRQMVHTVRASESVVRHPDATVAERKRASDAVAAQAATLQMLRRDQRKQRSLWPTEERSPVTIDPDDESEIDD